MAEDIKRLLTLNVAVLLASATLYLHVRPRCLLLTTARHELHQLSNSLFKELLFSWRGSGHYDIKMVNAKWIRRAADLCVAAAR